MSQPTISHHLAILIEAGVLLARQDGKHRFTSVNAPLVRRIGMLLPARLGTWAAAGESPGVAAARSGGEARRA